MGQQHSNKVNEPFIFGYYASQAPTEQFSNFMLDELYQIETSSFLKPDYISLYEQVHDDETDTLRDEEGWSRLTAPGYKRMNTLLDLSNQSLIKLSSSVSCLNNLTKLDLSNNLMISLPRAIGQLFNLCILNAAHNQLEFIPDTISQLKKLQVLNLNENKLTHLPKGFHLPQLQSLHLRHNQLLQLPQELAQFSELSTLDISYNPLQSIPAELASLKTLHRLLADQCPFESNLTYSLLHNPPSLFEICARQICNLKIPAPDILTDYFKQKKTCSFCSGPFFEASVCRKRQRLHGDHTMTLDYELCSAHWTDEEDRLLVLFSTGNLEEGLKLNEQDLALGEEEEEEDEVSGLSNDKHLTNAFFINNSTMQSFAQLGSRLRSGTL